MKYYFLIKNTEIIGIGQCPCASDGCICLEITEEQYNNAKEKGNSYYIYQDGDIVINPNYEQEQAEKEQERVGNLTMTALDFITFLRYNGIDLTTIREFLDNNIELDTQLKYCNNVYCKVVCNILPITIGDITITKDMVIKAFKEKNGEE